MLVWREAGYQSSAASQASFRGEEQADRRVSCRCRLERLGGMKEGVLPVRLVLSARTILGFHTQKITYLAKEWVTQ